MNGSLFVPAALQRAKSPTSIQPPGLHLLMAPSSPTWMLQFSRIKTLSVLDFTCTMSLALSLRLEHSLFQVSHNRKKLRFLALHQQLQLSSVVFETDCKLMKDSFESARFGQNVLLSRCRSFIASISNSYVSFIKRQVNYVVHNLARASQLHASSHDFICIPTYVLSYP